jgi:CheY-like chemotaxis protein
MKRILVIDDNASLRSDLLDLLGFEGYDAIEAENGEVGILAAREQLPDLIICDISMPVLDGFEVISVLRQHSQTEAIPVILLSAHTDQPTVQKGLELGAAAFLPKPYNLDDVLAVVRKYAGA